MVCSGKILAFDVYGRKPTTTVTFCYGAEWDIEPDGKVVALSGPVVSLSGWIVTAETGESILDDAKTVSWRGI
jgi:hypothetical protein